MSAPCLVQLAAAASAVAPRLHVFSWLPLRMRLSGCKALLGRMFVSPASPIHPVPPRISERNFCCNCFHPAVQEDGAGVVEEVVEGVEEGHVVRCRSSSSQ